MARIYGALTGIIVMMLWIYIVTISILLGARADAMSLSTCDPERLIPSNVAGIVASALTQARM